MIGIKANGVTSVVHVAAVLSPPHAVNAKERFARDSGQRQRWTRASAEWLIGMALARLLKVSAPYTNAPYM